MQTSTKVIIKNSLNIFSLFFKEPEKLFIIFTHKVIHQSAVEVEFLCDTTAAKRIPATVENEYTISVAAPGKYFLEVMCLFCVFRLKM